MKNIEITTEKNILTLKVDLTKTFGPSKSGKTTIIATTEGNPAGPTLTSTSALTSIRRSSQAKKEGVKNENFTDNLQAVRTSRPIKSSSMVNLVNLCQKHHQATKRS